MEVSRAAAHGRSGRASKPGLEFTRRVLYHVLLQRIDTKQMSGILRVQVRQMFNKLVGEKYETSKLKGLSLAELLDKYASKLRTHILYQSVYTLLYNEIDFEKEGNNKDTLLRVMITCFIPANDVLVKDDCMMMILTVTSDLVLKALTCGNLQVSKELIESALTMLATKKGHDSFNHWITNEEDMLAANKKISLVCNTEVLAYTPTVVKQVVLSRFCHQDGSQTRGECGVEDDVADEYRSKLKCDKFKYSKYFLQQHLIPLINHVGKGIMATNLYPILKANVLNQVFLRPSAVTQAKAFIEMVHYNILPDELQVTFDQIITVMNLLAEVTIAYLNKAKVQEAIDFYGLTVKAILMSPSRKSLITSGWVSMVEEARRLANRNEFYILVNHVVLNHIRRNEMFLQNRLALSPLRGTMVISRPPIYLLNADDANKLMEGTESTSIECFQS